VNLNVGFILSLILFRSSFSAIRAKLTSLKLQIQSKLSLGSSSTAAGTDVGEGTPIDEPGLIKASGYLKGDHQRELCFSL